MKIGVLLKRVPDTETRIKIASDAKSYDRDGVNYIVNPYDEFALEEALQINERTGGGEVVLLSLGTAKTEEALRTGLAMGAERAILISDEGLSDPDSLTTAKCLAAAAKAENFDLILCGVKAIDTEAGSVGPAVAELLGWPCVSGIVKLELSADGKTATVQRQIEGGAESVEVQLPVVLTAQKGLNTPRYPALTGIMKAKKKEIKQLTRGDIGLGDLAPKVVLQALTLPPPRSAGKILPGEPASPQELVRLLREEAKLIN
ncbi:MAG: electron transfer flavoprotein subunit beta/FixA family protein [Candidatus Sericytochromatia bacterium]|nr:electron transfer flavoprotein subunit beta/FixA family protein [Candidatus Sericytochromatia bacterium]